MNCDIAVGMIIFNPNISVLQRLQDTINNGYKLYIFDNSPDNSLIRDYVYKNAETSALIKYSTCGKNVGLGIGLASLCSQAYYDSFAALLFFDQDTVYSSVTLDFVSDFYSKNSILSKSYSAIAFNSKNIDASGSNTNEIKDVLLAMNSGSLFYLSNLKKMNWHNTKYFVDCVDYEFCLSSSTYHFKIGENSMTPGFDHCSEQGDHQYKVFGKVLPMRPYAHSRIRDSIKAYLKLIIKSILSRNIIYFIEISKTMSKYIFVQTYVRIALLFRSSRNKS